MTRQSVQRVQQKGHDAPVAVDRTPCFYCGIRADLGCSHNMNWAFFALRDRKLVNEAWDKLINSARADCGYGYLDCLVHPRDRRP